MSIRITSVKLAGLLGAVFFASDPAFAQGSGYVGVRYEMFELDLGGVIELDGGAVRVDGAYVIPLDGNFGIQLDASVARARTESFGQDSETLSGSATLFYRTDHFSISAFAGVGKLWVHGAPNDDHFGGGIEAKAYLGPVSLGATYSMIDSEGAFGTSGDGVDLSARFFPTDNLALHAGYTMLDVDFGPADFGLHVWRLGIEYQPRNFPLSFHGGYSRTESDSLGFTQDQVHIGLRYNFGTQTLKQRDRSGASLAAFSGAPR